MRRNLLKQFQPFAGHRRLGNDETGDVAARPRETRDETAADRIDNERENDGDGARLLQQRGRGGCGVRKNDVGLFDRVVCCGMVRGDSPRVSRAALYSLKALISGGFGGSSGGVIEARSYSLSQDLRWDVAKVATSTESKGRQQPRKRQAGRH
jgi:hypothetical protein